MTRFHCVYNWKLSNSTLMYFSGIDGVDSESEVVSDTDLNNKIAWTTNVKLSNHEGIERTRIVRQTPYWWCQSFLLRNDAMHVFDVDDDEVIRSVNTVGVDTFLCQNEVNASYSLHRK